MWNRSEKSCCIFAPTSCWSHEAGYSWVFSNPEGCFANIEQNRTPPKYEAAAADSWGWGCGRVVEWAGSSGGTWHQCPSRRRHYQSKTTKPTFYAPLHTGVYGHPTQRFPSHPYLVEPAWLWESQSRMATMLRLEKYGRIDFSPRKWTKWHQNAAKSRKACAKDEWEPAGTFFHSLFKA